MKAMLLSLAIALELSAQSPISLTRSECPPTNATTLRLVMYAPASIAGRTVTVPVCVDFAEGSLVNVDGVLRLQLPKPVVPILRMETIPLPPSAPSDQTTLDYTLAATPIAGSPVLWFLASSRGRQSGAVSASSAVQGRAIKITLPEWRPFTADDVVTIVYQAQPE